MNVCAKSDEFSSMPLEVNEEKPKCNGWTDGWTDGRTMTKKAYPNKHRLREGGGVV